MVCSGSVWVFPFDTNNTWELIVFFSQDQRPVAYIKSAATAPNGLCVGVRGSSTLRVTFFCFPFLFSFAGQLDGCRGVLQDPGGGGYRGQVHRARICRPGRLQHRAQVPRHKVINGSPFPQYDPCHATSWWGCTVPAHGGVKAPWTTICHLTWGCFVSQ